MANVTPYKNTQEPAPNFERATTTALDTLRIHYGGPSEMCSCGMCNLARAYLARLAGKPEPRQ